MQIRLLEESDYESFHTLWLQALRECPGAFGDDEIEAQKRVPAKWAMRLKQSPMYGSFQDGNLTGLVGLGLNEQIKRKHLAGIGPLYVAPEFRRRGIAKKLVEYAITQAPDCVEKIKLGVNANNPAAIKLYEGLGFIAWGTEAHALKLRDGTYADVIWMQKVISWPA